MNQIKLLFILFSLSISLLADDPTSSSSSDESSAGESDESPAEDNDFDGADLIREYPNGRKVAYFFFEDTTMRILDNMLGEFIIDPIAPAGIFYSPESGAYYGEPQYTDDGDVTYFEYDREGRTYTLAGGYVAGIGHFTRIFDDGDEITFRLESQQHLLFTLDLETERLHVADVTTGEHLQAFLVPADLREFLALPNAGLTVIAPNRLDEAEALAHPAWGGRADYRTSPIGLGGGSRPG